MQTPQYNGICKNTGSVGFMLHLLNPTAAHCMMLTATDQYMFPCCRLLYRTYRLLSVAVRGQTQSGMENLSTRDKLSQLRVDKKELRLDWLSIRTLLLKAQSRGFACSLVAMGKPCYDLKGVPLVLSSFHTQLILRLPIRHRSLVPHAVKEHS